MKNQNLKIKNNSSELLKKYINGKVAVFIDAANIIYSQRTLKWHISFKKLAKYLKSSCNLIVLNFYYASREENQKQKIFFSILKDSGYKIITKQVKLIKQEDGTILVKGNLDVELALDAFEQAEFYDSIILLSGDSDFETLLKRLRSKNKTVLVISARKHIARELINISNKYIPLNQLRSEIEMLSDKKSPPKTGG